MIFEWLTEREEKSIHKHGWYSGQTEFWTLLLDSHFWLTERVSPRAWIYHMTTLSPPMSWAEIRKQNHSKYKY